jgi:DNA-directed RNA polymerase subunit F
MSKPETIEKTPMSLTEVKQQLKTIKKRDGELGFRANKTEEYLNQFSTINLKQESELKEKLEKLKIPMLKAEHIIKIIDMLPKSVNELKVIMQGFTINLTNENMTKIINAVKPFLPEKK